MAGHPANTDNTAYCDEACGSDLIGHNEEIQTSNMTSNGKPHADDNMAGHADEPYTNDMAPQNLQATVNERVLVEWKDSDTDKVFTLGSLSSHNRTDARLALKIDLDTVEFSMVVRMQTAGRSRRDMKFLIVVPISTVAAPALSYESMQASQVAGPVISSALQNAGLTNSGQVLRARVCMHHDGSTHTFIQRNSAKKIKPNNSTTRDLLLGFKSFSQARTFNVYFKPSDYARQGLRTVTERLQNNKSPVRDFSLERFCIQRDIQPVNWTILGLGIDHEDDSLPPSYNQARGNKSPEIQAERTPEAEPGPGLQHSKDPLGLSQPLPIPLFDWDAVMIPETPPRKAHDQAGHDDRGTDRSTGCGVLPSASRPGHQHTSGHVTSSTDASRSVTPRVPKAPVAGTAGSGSSSIKHSVASSVALGKRIAPAPSLGQDRNGTQTNADEADDRKRRHMEGYRKREHAPPTKAELPPESLPPLQQLTQRAQHLREHLSSRQISTNYSLLTELFEWLHHASVINIRINEHPHVKPYIHAMGEYSRSGDKEAFTDARASAAAIFAFDPHNEISISSQEDSAACAFFIADIRRLISQAFELHPRADIEVQNMLFDVGIAARRAVRQQPVERCESAGGNTFATVEYAREKAGCETLIAFCWGNSCWS